MAKDFRTNVKFNNAVNVIGNLTASIGTTTLGNTSFKADANGISIYSSDSVEGGQINLYGGTSYSSSVMQIDNYQGNMRILNNNGAAVAMSITNATGLVTINSANISSASVNGQSLTPAQVSANLYLAYNFI